MSSQVKRICSLCREDVASLQIQRNSHGDSIVLFCDDCGACVSQVVDDFFEKYHGGGKPHLTLDDIMEYLTDTHYVVV